jgi:hypothetical protein
MTQIQIIDDLLLLIKTMSADWTPFRERHNIAKDTQILYDNYSPRMANELLAYIILAYFQKSPWMRANKDRLENKMEIMSTLVRKTWRHEAPYLEVIENREEITNQVIIWALHFQQDWRFPQIEAYKSYQAIMRLRGTRTDFEDNKSLVELGKVLDEGKERRIMADAMEAEMDRDYAKINNALEQEGLPKLSDIPSNLLTWEQWIMLKKQRNEQLKSEEERGFEE